MSGLNCNVCGGELDLQPHLSYGVCQFCGHKQPLSRSGNSELFQALNHANDLRRQCEFDEAIEAYNDLLGMDSENAEASGALLHRCESAAVYAAENPETVFIATGGKGADEPITEAECIKREMVRLGVPEERILLEEQSQSTAENMKYSRAMMEKEDAAVAVVTNNFHVYRAGRLAEAAFEGPVYRQSAEFTWILLPHYIVREAVCSVLDALNGYMRLW